MLKCRSILAEGISIAVVLLSAVFVFAQERDDVKQTLFGDVEQLLEQVQAEQGNILCPTKYRDASNTYRQALKSFEEGGQLKDIREKLTDVRNNLQRCIEIAEAGKTIFATTLRARDDALKANAPEHASEQFDEAEEEFNSAAKKLERNDVRGAKKNVPEIDEMYRTAELNAIKASIIGNVRNLMKEARDVEAHKHTPITYANAQKLLTEAEHILNSNRRSESSAQEKAEAAENEALHAIYLTRQIKWLRKNEKEWENYIVGKEVLIEKIAQELGFTPTFDEGMDKPLNTIARIVRTLQQEKQDLLAEVDAKNEEIRKLNSELQQYRKKEEGLQAELQEKQYKLEMKRKREERIRSIEEMFTPEEAVVLRQGNDLIIRLIGLTFPSGKETIRPEFFDLLATVQRAIRKFPNDRITIEGHTDAVGDERYNENLSYKRAQAVKRYLIANMGLDESRITALGYGETKPIASNETNQGKAQNRRIDIVITFGQEVL